MKMGTRGRAPQPVAGIPRRPVLLATLAACASLTVPACMPEPVIKRTALIPAPYLPSRTGAPLDDLQVRIQGEVNPVRLSTGEDPVSSTIHDTVLLGDPGLLVPQAELGASVYFAPIRYIEIGAQFHVASWRWSRANKNGVLDFPDGEKRNVWQSGFGLRGNLPIRRIDLTFSPILEINFVHVPEATFVRDSATNRYRFDGMYESFWTYPAFFLQVDKGFLESRLHLQFLVGLERTLTNTGFDVSDPGHSTVRSALAVPIGLGLEFTWEWFAIGATFFYPVAVGDNLEAGTFGPSLALRIGTILGGRPRSELPPAYQDPVPRERRHRRDRHAAPVEPLPPEPAPAPVPIEPAPADTAPTPIPPPPPADDEPPPYETAPPPSGP